MFGNILYKVTINSIPLPLMVKNYNISKLSFRHVCMTNNVDICASEIVPLRAYVCWLPYSLQINNVSWYWYK